MRSFRLASIILTALLLASSCGKDSEKKAAPNTPATTPPPPPKEEPVAINIPFEERLNAVEIHPDRCQTAQAGKLNRIAEELRVLYAKQLGNAATLSAARNVNSALSPYFSRVRTIAQGCKLPNFESFSPEEIITTSFAKEAAAGCGVFDPEGALLGWKIFRLGEATRTTLAKLLGTCGQTDSAANETRFRRHPLGALYLKGQLAASNACSLDHRYFAEEAGMSIEEGYLAVTKPQPHSKLLALQLHLSLALSFRKLSLACEREKVKEPALVLQSLETELIQLETNRGACETDGDLAKLRKRALDAEPADLERLLSRRLKQTVKNRYQSFFSKAASLEASCAERRGNIFRSAHVHGIRAKWAEFSALGSYSEARLEDARKLQTEAAAAKVNDQKLALSSSDRMQLEKLYEEINSSIRQWLETCRANLTAEKKRLEEEKRKEEERKRVEDEKRKKEEAEKKRLEEEKQKKEDAERKRIEEEKRKKDEAEKKRIEEEKRKEEERARVEEEKRKEEERKRVEDEKRKKEEAEKKRLEEEKQKKEDAERKRIEEEKRKKDEAEKTRIEEEKRKDEERTRLEEERKRVEDEKRKKEEAEKKRLEEEKQKKEDAERKRIEKEKRKEEERKRMEEERRRREEEQKKIEQEKKRLEEERNRAEGEKYRSVDEKRSRLKAPLWDRESGSKAWTNAVVSVLRKRMPDFDKARDADTFCPGYRKAELHERENCWLMIISAISKHESNFQSGDSFTESSGEDSIGLLALSPGQCANAPTAKALGNPVKNLICGTNRMARLIARDGVIDGADVGPNGIERRAAKGATAYWSTLKPRYKSYHKIKKKWLNVGFKHEIVGHSRHYKDPRR